MKNNNDNLFKVILGGVIACFICLAMVFLFPQKNSEMKSNLNNSPGEEINLGDADCPNGTSEKYCSSGTLSGNECIGGTVSGYYEESDCEAAGYVWSSGACHSVSAPKTRCKSCFTGYKLENGSCVEDKITCSQGTYYSGQGNCSTCPAGYYCPGVVANVLDEGKGRTACPVGTYSTGGARECSQCSGTNQYQDETGQSSCKTCTNNQVPNSSHTACVEGTFHCPGSYNSDPNATSNSQCYITVAAGSEAIWNGSTHTTSKCGAGKYAPSSRKVYMGSSSECSTCSGTVNTDHTTCETVVASLACNNVDYNGEEQTIATCTNCTLTINGTATQSTYYRAKDVGSYSITGTGYQGAKFANGATTASCTANIKAVATPTPKPITAPCCATDSKGNMQTIRDLSDCKRYINDGLTVVSGECPTPTPKPITAPCCVINSTDSVTQYDDLQTCQYAQKQGANVLAGTCAENGKVPKKCTVSISTASQITSVHNDNVENSYYTVVVNITGDDCKGQTVSYSATNSRSVTPSSYSISSDLTGTRSVSFIVRPAQACVTSVATARLTNGNSDSASTVITKTDWHMSVVCEKNPTYTSFSSADAAGADVYYSAYGTCSDGVTKGWTQKWTRGGCGSGGSTPSSACYAKTACYKKQDNSFIWTDSPESGWVVQSSITKQADCHGSVVSSYSNYVWTSSPNSSWTIQPNIAYKDCHAPNVTPVPTVKPTTTPTPSPTPPPTKPSYCYIKDDGSYEWTNTPEQSWVIVPGVTNPSDCKETEDDACYLDPQGNYVWGKYATTKGYTRIAAITDKNSCKAPTPEYACYMNKDNDYIWSDTKPDGYVKVEGVTRPEDCGPEEAPACYYNTDTDKIVWGTYGKITGYIILPDILSEDECKFPDIDACYQDKNGNYVWGKYGNDPDYKLVPSVTDITQCKNDPYVPKTDTNVSKLVYIFMAILMACGIGFIYYSTSIKKHD